MEKLHPIQTLSGSCFTILDLSYRPHPIRSEFRRPLNPNFSYLVKKQSAHAAKLKLLYEQCGNHAEEYYPNIISNYGEELPVECEHEINSLFPSKRISGPDFEIFLVIRLTVCPHGSQRTFRSFGGAVGNIRYMFGNLKKFIINQRSLHQNAMPLQAPIQSIHHLLNFLTMKSFHQNPSVSLVTDMAPKCNQNEIENLNFLKVEQIHGQVP